MESKIRQTFNGIINGVEFKSKTLYYATEIILQGIERKKEIIINDKNLTAGIRDALEDYYLNEDYFVDLIASSYVSSEFFTRRHTLKDIRIRNKAGYDLSEYHFSKINKLTEELKNGDYEYLFKQEGDKNGI